MFSEIYPITFRGIEKASLREGGGTRSVTEGACATYEFDKDYCAALSLTRLRRELPPGGSLFYVHLCLINFPDKHCICVHKRKIRHTSFEIYRILAKLSFRVRP